MFKAVFGIFSTSSLILAAGASSTIGVAKSSSDFLLDGAAVYSNATVFDGSSIETQAAPSVVRLSNSELTVLPSSKATLHADRVTVEKGAIISRNQIVDAGNLHIAPSSNASLLRIEVVNANLVLVTAAQGAGEVRDSSGKVIASLPPGSARSFTRNAQGGTSVGVAPVDPIVKRPVTLIALPKSAS
jgi:hypothetical protein